MAAPLTLVVACPTCLTPVVRSRANTWDFTDGCVACDQCRAPKYCSVRCFYIDAERHAQHCCPMPRNAWRAAHTVMMEMQRDLFNGARGEEPYKLKRQELELEGCVNPVDGRPVFLFWQIVEGKKVGPIVSKAVAPEELRELMV